MMNVRISDEFKTAYKRLKKKHKSLDADFENVSDAYLRDILKRMP